MRLTSTSTKVLLLLAVLFAVAFGGDDNSIYFNLSTNRIYAPGDTGIAVEISGALHGESQVRLRAYRVEHPVEFFLQQKDPHSPEIAGVKPNTFDMLRLGFDKAKKDAHFAAREVMPVEARRSIRDVADLNGVKAAKDSSAARRERGDMEPGLSDRFPLVTSWEAKVTPRDSDQGWIYDRLPVPIREKGVYLIEATIRGKRALTALVISDLGMIIKQVSGQTMVFVADRKSGKSISSFPLTFARNGKKLSEGSTDGDGVSLVSLPPPPPMRSSDDDDGGDEDDWQWEWRQRQLLVLGERDGDFVISDPWSYDDEGESRRIYLHTDRPVYRPGQTVYYRGIARLVQQDGTYQTTSGDTVRIEVSDARGNVFQRDTLRLSDMGTFNGQLALADEPPLGSYSIKVGIGKSESWFNFSVEEYKKPEYKVEVTTDRQNYTRGDVIHATVKADYFFGSPVANAQVEYFVYRSEYWRPWWRNSEWAYLYSEDGDDDFYTYRMEMVNSGSGTLNPDGTFTITYQTDPKADKDYVYRVEANVVDNSRRSISGARSVEVTRGEFYITSRTDKYVYRPGDEAKVSVSIATFQGDMPVATTFHVRAIRTWWEKRTVPSDSGDYALHKEVLWTGTGTTDAKGNGSVIYKPERAGYFELEVTATDSRGTVVSESPYIYVADEAYADWYHEGSGDVQIIPDKEAYQPGETMSALVIMPAAGIDALITTEGNMIYSHQVERLSSNSVIVHVPIEDHFAPDFFLSASALVNDQIYSESQRVAVIPRGKSLRLEVKTDKEVYKPGEHGTLMVRALDENNEPVSDVDVAIGMADEAVYSIEPDATPNIQRYFYGNRWNQVNTTASLEFNFYGGAAKARGFAATDEMGRAGSHAPMPMMARAERKTADRQSIAFGDVKGTMFVEPVVRRNFKDLMFWTPSARTDADGWARMPVEFPDNLTTWRITARGVTRQTAVGQTVARVIARKDLLVRMETPRFLTQGDELLIATTVHNYLASDKITKVRFDGDNVTLDARERTVTIPANGEQRIDWKITAPKTGTAKLTVKALTNEESDAMELAVPVLPRGIEAGTGAASDIEERSGTRTVSLTLPQESDPVTGAMYVTLAPSLASSILNALDELIGYPYGCVEQTMSRFLPTVLVDNTLKQLNLPFDAKKREQIPKMVGKGLAKLYGMQHDDGGWGWWTWDKSDPFMTAYVMYGMTVAQEAGYQVLPERYASGMSALRARIESGLSVENQPVDATTQAYMLYVMSMINRSAPQAYLLDRIRSLSRRDSINNYARALLAMAAENQSDRTLALSIVGQLERAATIDGNFALWKGRSWHYTWQDDEVETSSAAVKAIFDLKGETDLVKRGIRWIVSQKDGDAWHNTRQTAMAIYSLVDYLKGSHELDPDYTVVVRVNGQQVFSGRMTREDVFKPEQRIRLERASLHAGANTVTIEKNGNGRLYATSRLNYYATGNAIRPASAGFRVSREYYTLEKQRRGDEYVYTKRPFSGTVRTGDILFVKVHVTPDASFEYFMLEDPLPPGCEVVTNTDGYTIAGEPEYDEKMRESRGYDFWNWWYADRDVRDEKISFFARTILPHQYDFSYVLRAQIPGSYAVMPSLATLMYYPEVRGNGALTAMTITP